MTALRWLRPRTAVVLCGAWTIALAITPAAYAQDDAFRAGLDARGDKKWADVVLQMRRAIQANPQESDRKVRSRLGGLLRQGGTEYLPHFFLGEALFNLQECAGAIEAWANSERQRVVESRPDFMAILQRGYVACEAKGVLPPGKYDPLHSRTTQHLNEVNAQAENVVKMGSTNIDLWQDAARVQYERASAEIETARRSLQAAARTRAQSDFTAANSAADRASRLLATIDATLTSAISARLTLQRDTKEVDEVITKAAEYDRAIESKRSLLTASLASVRAEGREALSLARDRLGSGGRAPGPSALGESRALAVDAAAKFKQVLDELAGLEKELLRQRVDQGVRVFASLNDAVARLDRLSAENPQVLQPAMVVERDAIKRQVALTRRRFDVAQSAASGADLAEAIQLASDVSSRLTRLISAFGPIPITERGVHPALAEGARLFFAGEYQQSLAVLSPATGFSPDVPLRLHIHLFRAAALYALFIRSDPQDAALRTKALAEVEECHRIDPDFQPDSRAFSPSFLAFFRSVAPTLAATGAGDSSQR
jgi:hypothetical protein